MQVVPFPARQDRIHYRHELRNLTYATLDAANGGIVRNLSSKGVALQVAAPLHQQQNVNVRFDLRLPRVRVEAYGRVSWADSSGRCGIRFVDLPPRTAQQIDEWIFSNLLDTVERQMANSRSIFRDASRWADQEEGLGENEGLTASASVRAPIRLEAKRDRLQDAPLFELYRETGSARRDVEPETETSWLSRPLSGRSLAWLVDGLLVLAALLLFTLIFLAIAHELPSWPLTLSVFAVATILVVVVYRTLFAMFGGASLGARLARVASSSEAEDHETDVEVHFR
jgi:hypothetical protein